MSFIDLDELKQDAEDEGIVPHPLKDVLTASNKDGKTTVGCKFHLSREIRKE